jgi:hypothetical protein
MKKINDEDELEGFTNAILIALSILAFLTLAVITYIHTVIN